MYFGEVNQPFGPELVPVLAYPLSVFTSMIPASSKKLEQLQTNQVIVSFAVARTNNGISRITAMTYIFLYTV